jgi:hypothetical protein
MPDRCDGCGQAGADLGQCYTTISGGSAEPDAHTLCAAYMDQRTIKRLGRSTAIVLLLLTLTPASAQDASPLSRGQVFHDAAGRVTGSARTDANGVTTFHDRAGRVIGTARTDSNGVTTFHDASGRVTGSIRR